jgi:hypothetical protein
VYSAQNCEKCLVDLPFVPVFKSRTHKYGKTLHFSKTTTTKPGVNSGALEGCAVSEKSTESYILHMQVLIVFIPQKTSFDVFCYQEVH